MWPFSFFWFFAPKKIFLIFFYFFSKGHFAKRHILEKEKQPDTPSASMATEDTCEFSKMLMNIPPESVTPAQMHSGIIRTSVLMLDYMKIDSQDKGLTWCLFRRKEDERHGVPGNGAEEVCVRWDVQPGERAPGAGARAHAQAGGK
jgi:hypothetical protein